MAMVDMGVVARGLCGTSELSGISGSLRLWPWGVAWGERIARG